MSADHLELSPPPAVALDADRPYVPPPRSGVGAAVACRTGPRTKVPITALQSAQRATMGGESWAFGVGVADRS